MNRFCSAGLTVAMTLGACTLWSQDLGPAPAPARAPRVTVRRAPPVPPAPPERIEPPEATDPAEPPLPPEPADVVDAPEPIEPHALRHPMGLGPMAFALQVPPRPPHPTRSSEGDHYYERGQSSLEHSRWDEALQNFSEVVARGGSRADGALYWKAYALNRLGRRDEALAALAELRKTYASSRWMDDAKALDLEVRQAAGKQVSPEAAGDEELKLMALNGIMNSDPEKAIPLVEKLLHSSQSPKVKERALFVLTQSDSPRARQLVVQLAKGGGNPDLQMKAVNYLGVMDAQKELGEVYGASGDVAVKRAVLHAFMVADGKDQLLTAAKGEKNQDLRREAIHELGVLDAHSELWQLYQAEPSLEVKREIVHALFVGGNTDRLLEIARTAKEVELRRDAVHGLGNMDDQRAGSALAAMYAHESDLTLRREIIHALSVQDNAHALVEMARKETNVELKKEIVQQLSHMESKEGTDYLMELLNK